MLNLLNQRQRLAIQLTNQSKTFTKMRTQHLFETPTTIRILNNAQETLLQRKNSCYIPLYQFYALTIHQQEKRLSSILHQ
jgi:hypothetical protein